MNKTRKFKIKKTLLISMLIVALIGVQVLEVAAYAADEGIADKQPKVIVSNYSQLYSEMLKANDGDVIGIDNCITVLADNEVIGDSDKCVTIVRINDAAYFELAAKNVTVQNIIFDGKNIDAGYSMVRVNSDTIFKDSSFQNCNTYSNGGGIFALGGNVTITNCTFFNNSASTGGHIAIWNDAKVDISESTFENGCAVEKGGAILNDSVVPYSSITGSLIHNNSAGICGGGIYNNSRIVIEQTKIYGNTAANGGGDIANTDASNLQITESIDELALLFRDMNILPTAWVNDYDFESGVLIPGISPELPNSFMKLNYEVVPTKVILAESSLGIAGNSKITGLESEKCYKVSTDETVCYSKSDGTLTFDAAEAELLNGTEIVGLVNGKSYMVEEYTLTPESTEPPIDPTPEPGDPPTESTPDTPDGGKDDEGDTPESPGEESSKPDQGNEDNSGSQNPDPTPTPDKPDDKGPAPSPSPDTDNKDDAPSTPSNSSTSTTDNSSTKDDHSSTKNDYSKTTHTSNVNNNYYGTDKSEPGNKTETAASQGASSQTIVVEKSVPVFAQTETTFSDEADKKLLNEDIPGTSIPQNIRIEANGADCVFELNEEGYNISINANPNRTPESVVTDKDSVNWYELVKICLLAAIVVTLLWKSKKPIE